MKKLLQFILFLFPLIANCQINGYDFQRTDLLDYERILVTQINYYTDQRDSSVFTDIYQLNKNGDIERVESYENDSLKYWSRCEYDSLGRKTLEENHNEIYSYDEDLNKHIPSIREDHYSGVKFIYSDNRLVEKRWFNYSEGSVTISIIENFLYNEGGKLIQKNIHNLYIGMTGSFLPNSATLDSIYYKDSKSMHFSTFDYHDNTVIETQYDETGKIYGYVETRLSSSELPIEITEKDENKEPFIVYNLKYNSGDNLTERIREIIDMSKIYYDITVEDRYEIEYNNDSLPQIGLTYWNNQLISKRILKYE